MDKISLKNMKFFAYHGVLEEEQEKGQEFYLDVEMFLDLSVAGNSDNLHDTVNYAEVFEITKNITTGNKFRLIESLAEVISGEMLSKYEKIQEICVRVRKPQAPIEGEFDFMEVEVKRVREID